MSKKEEKQFVTLQLPKNYYEFLEALARFQKQSLEEYLVNEVILKDCGPLSDLDSIPVKEIYGLN